MLAILRGCLDAGIHEFVVPLADCGAMFTTGCAGPVTIRGFATVRLVSVFATGSPKGVTLQVLCTADGPCGLGVCPADCASCPVDCGGCAPACS